MSIYVVHIVVEILATTITLNSSTSTTTKGENLITPQTCQQQTMWIYITNTKACHQSWTSADFISVPFSNLLPATSGFITFSYLFHVFTLIVFQEPSGSYLSTISYFPTQVTWPAHHNLLHVTGGGGRNSNSSSSSSSSNSSSSSSSSNSTSDSSSSSSIHLADATPPPHNHSTWRVAQYVTSSIGLNNLPSTLFPSNCNLWTKTLHPLIHTWQGHTTKITYFVLFWFVLNGNIVIIATDTIWISNILRPCHNTIFILISIFKSVLGLFLW